MSKENEKGTKILDLHRKKKERKKKDLQKGFYTIDKNTD